VEFDAVYSVACIQDVRYAETLFPLDTKEYSSPVLVTVETRQLADNCESTACGNIAPCPDGQFCYDMWRTSECRWEMTCHFPRLWICLWIAFTLPHFSCLSLIRSY